MLGSVVHVHVRNAIICVSFVCLPGVRKNWEHKGVRATRGSVNFASFQAFMPQNRP